MKNKHTKPLIYHPAFLNLQGKRCVVVGGGEVALRKVKNLLDCGADATIISSTLHSGLIRLAKNRTIRLIKRDYESGDLIDADIAIAATNSKEINKKVSEEAKKQKIFVNVVDDPEKSDFIVPSFFRRGYLTIAISTAGKSPAFARIIRTKLEKNFGKEYASLLSLVGEIRSKIKKKGVMVSEEVWEKALDIDLLIHLVEARQFKKAKAFLLSKLKPIK